MSPALIALFPVVCGSVAVAISQVGAESSSDVEPRQRGGSRGLLGFGAKPFIKLDPGDAERPVDPDGRQNAAGDQSIDVPPAQPQPFGDLVWRKPLLY